MPGPVCTRSWAGALAHSLQSHPSASELWWAVIRRTQASKDAVPANVAFGDPHCAGGMQGVCVCVGGGGGGGGGAPAEAALLLEALGQEVGAAGAIRQMGRRERRWLPAPGAPGGAAPSPRAAQLRLPRPALDSLHSRRLDLVHAVSTVSARFSTA